MSQTSTYNLVPGTPQNIVSPTSVSSWANAVIINLTTGTLYLNVGGSPLTLPQLQSIQVKNPGMTANLTATATVSGTLEVIWYFQGEVVPTTVPVTATDITVNGPVDITGPVSVYTSGADLVSTQSKAAAFSESLTPASGGGTASATVTIPTSPVMHAALVSGVYTITAASNQPIQIQVTGNNTNTLYYNFDNLTTNVTNQAIPEAVIAISAADTALIVSHVSSGGTQSSVINLNFYSQAIPPDPYVASLITQGLFGTTAETVINPLVSPPLLQSVYNTQISTNWGIKVADALAPADSYQGLSLTSAADAYWVNNTGVPVIVKFVSAFNTNTSTYISFDVTDANNNVEGGVPFASLTGYQPNSVVSMYVPANYKVRLSTNATGTVYGSFSYTTL